MKTQKTFRVLCAASLMVACVVAAAPASAQEEVSVTFLVEARDEAASEMTATVGGGSVRLDMGPAASMIMSENGMLMIMHAQKMYMEFDKAMLEQMQRMMASMPNESGGTEANDEFDPTQYTFEQTGNTDEIMGYDVFEVNMTGPDGQKAALWMSEDAEVGMFTVWGQMAEHLEKLAGPMMRGPGAGSNAAGRMKEYMNLAHAQGLPEGQVLRVVSDDSTMTVTGFEWGPFGAAIWMAPEGYQKQSMPGMPRR